MKRSLTDYPLAGKRVLVRVDFNVPLDGGRVVDDTRIRAALPTITYLLDQGCALVLASHLGRPKGQVVDEPPHGAGGRAPGRAAGPPGRDGRRLRRARGRGGRARRCGRARCSCSRTCASTPRRRPTTASSPEQLAGLADVYVNDAFGTAHRAHASTEGVTHYLPSVAGLLMIRELEILGRLLRDPARPFVVVLGGLKVSDKIGVIEKMLGIADAILIGGAMANAFLAAKGYGIGQSQGDGDQVAVAARVLARRGGDALRAGPAARRRGGARGGRGRASRVVPPTPSPPTRWRSTSARRPWPRSRGTSRGAGTIYWNGPMGLFEIDDFSAGTKAVGEAIAASAAVTVAGGGDTVAAARALRPGGAHDARLHGRRRVDGVP